MGRFGPLQLTDCVQSCTTPGGYAELAELGTELFSDDGTLASDNPGKVHIALLNEAMSRIGRRPQTGDTMKELLEKAGFENINVLKLKQPLGQWPKEKRLKHVGTMNIVNGETGGCLV